MMGHYADRFTLTDGISKTKYFLNTGSSNPFGRKYPAFPVLKNKSVTNHTHSQNLYLLYWGKFVFMPFAQLKDIIL